MMTREEPAQSRLFVPKDLGDRVPPDHILRRIKEHLDLSFVYDQVESTYGAVGQRSVPPATILKMMLLLTLNKVEFERAFFRDLPMRIDWLWFLGYDLGSEIPNHSVLSKARKRWGPGVFEQLFARTIEICLKKGLIGGDELLTDSSLIDANASPDSLFKVAQQVAASAAARLEDSVDDSTENPSEDQPPINEPKYRSKTDPDATGAKRRGETRMRARYQTHRGVDAAHGVITATVVGPGHENEAHRLEELINQHTEHTGHRVTVLTADSKYATVDNMEYLEINHIEAYANPLRNAQRRRGAGKFSECCFRYDKANDCFICPAGQKLVRVTYRAERDTYRYKAPAAICQSCPARASCTTSSTGRTVDRQARQPILDRATERIKSDIGRAHLKRRQWMMEGSFARSVRLGYKRARTRGLRNMRIQDYLVAAVQNLLVLIWSRKQTTRQHLTTHPNHLSGAISAVLGLLAALGHPWRFFATLANRYTNSSALATPEPQLA